MPDKDDLPTTHIYSSGYEFQCDECEQWTTLGDTRPSTGSIVICQNCGKKYEVESS